MKVTKKTYTKEVQYWDCGLGHRHRTKPVAVKCMGKSIVKQQRAVKNNDIELRNKKMVDYWLKCRNFKKTAEHFSISYGWATEIIQRSKRYYHATGVSWAWVDGYGGLDFRAIRFFKKVGINSIDDVLNYYKKEFSYPKRIYYHEFRESTDSMAWIAYIRTYIFLRDFMGK